MFKANQLFSFQINVLYNLLPNKGILTMSLKFPVKFSPSLTPLRTYAFKTGDPFVHFGMTKEKWKSNKKMKLAIGILTCHVDDQGYVEKHFFGCVAQKLKHKIKFLPATLRI